MAKRAKTVRRIRLSEPTFTESDFQAVLRLLRRGRVTQGEKVRAFEQAMLEYVGAAPGTAACMVNSGSSANLLASELLKRLNRTTRERFEVIMPAVAWSTTVAPFIQQGFRPVFVDVGADYTMDPEQAAKAVGPLTAGVVTVNLLGHSSNLPALCSLGVPVVEDACEALGAAWAGKKAGSRCGDGVLATTFSFYFSHHLNTIEGGMLLYHGEHQNFVSALREHGWTRSWPEVDRRLVEGEGIDSRFLFAELGYNLRSTEINALLGLSQLRKQEEWRAQRMVTANYYKYKLRHESLLHAQLPKESRPNPFSYAIRIREGAPYSRADLVEFLEARGVETRPVMTGNITRQPWYRSHPASFRVNGPLEMADALHDRGFLIPCHQSLSMADLQHIRDCFDSFLRERGVGGLE